MALQRLHIRKHETPEVIQWLEQGRITTLRFAAWDLYESQSGQHEKVRTDVVYREGAFHLTCLVYETDPGIRGVTFHKSGAASFLAELIEQARADGDSDFFVELARPTSG